MQSMGSQRVGHDWATELNWTEMIFKRIKVFCCSCLVTKSCPTLCDFIIWSPPGSSVHGISQVRILEWVAISCSCGSSDLGIEPVSPSLARVCFTSEEPGKPPYVFQFSRSVVSDSLRPHGLQHARPPCPSPTPGVHPNSCPLSRWCHPAISSSVVPFFSHPQFPPASGSFPMSQLFLWGGQS